VSLERGVNELLKANDKPEPKTADEIGPNTEAKTDTGSKKLKLEAHHQ
jgi:hypothetical protein